ncbi:protein kinase domain-containing protein [Finegoldia magna]|uniref:protein kinase domain-containing protein n=1 Tax=Finegoldia magna TaxID=1260 RepID=UPI000D71AF7B|nr:protein kinase [Finegoldia magna]PWV48067.1 serine/threonine protein kinase [Finegoldia magna]
MKVKPDKRGGNSDIYFTEDLKARKYLRNTSSREKIKRFELELEIMGFFKDNHVDGIIDVYDVFVDSNDIKESYIEMKKYDGNINDLLCYTKGDVRKTLELLLPILRALNKISKFKNPIYHRDLKPDNILYEKDGEDYKLFLTDFGICYLDKEKERLTEVEIAVGPRMFIAPEYEKGRIDNVDHKGDIFSIGKVIWYMINGVENDFLPSNYWFVDEYNLVKKFANNEDIIFANNIISICLNINPEERPDYDELINLIENFLKETKIDNNERLKFEIRQYNEKRKIDLKEIREKNALLVNTFSICFVKALEKLNNCYNLDLISTILSEYKSKSKNGVDYTSINMEHNSAHYLYNRSFDRIYISINYNPANDNEKYCNVDINYHIYSKNTISKLFRIFYKEDGELYSEFKNKIELFSEEVVLCWGEDLISEYVRSYV